MSAIAPCSSTSGDWLAVDADDPRANHQPLAGYVTHDDVGADQFAGANRVAP
jgi:hypothetical protein